MAEEELFPRRNVARPRAMQAEPPTPERSLPYQQQLPSHSAEPGEVGGEDYDYD
eukprot:SAG22_NODE_16571_length_322_cov_1.094170_1_plen_53_part_10